MTTSNVSSAHRLEQFERGRKSYAFCIWWDTDIKNIRGYAIDHLTDVMIAEGYAIYWVFVRDDIRFVVATQDKQMPMGNAKVFAQCVLDGNVTHDLVTMPVAINWKRGKK